MQYLGTTIDNVRVPKPDPLANIRYSYIHYARHFCDVNPGNSRPGTEDIERTDRIIRGVFLHWLEAAALLPRMSEGIVSIQRLEISLKVSDLSELII